MSFESDTPKNADVVGKPAPGPDGLNRDLDEFFGTWVEDPEFDKAIEEFERIDLEYWGMEAAGGEHADA